MCSPKVAEVVRERIQNEGLPNVSRRSFLKFSGLTAALAGLATTIPTLAKPQAQAVPSSVVDLSHVLSPDFPVFPAFSPAEVTTLVSVEENGFYAQQWTFGEHTSTHMDFPGHFIADGQLVDQMEVGLLIGSAVVIDISSKAAEDADAVVTVEDIEAWESENGEIPEGAFVFMYSGWESRLEEDGTYLNQDDDGTLHFPGFSKEAAEFLANERSLHGVGVDTLSLDPGNSTTFDAHYAILGAGLLGVENVANLMEIMGRQATVICGIPKYQNGSGGPVRVLALVAE